MRYFRIRFALTLVVAMLVQAPLAAHGAETVKMQSQGVSILAPPFGEGGRWVAWQVDATYAIVLDRRDASTTRFEVPRCTAVETTEPVFAELAGAGGGHLLWACLQHASRAYPLIQTIAAPSTATEIPGAGPGFADQSYGLTLDGIGRRWLRAEAGDSRGRTRPLYVPLSGGPARNQIPGDMVADLDLDALSVRPCSGIAKQLGGSIGLRVTYRHPFAVRESPNGIVRLLRCNGSRRVICRFRCVSVEMSRSWVAWIGDGVVRAESLRARRHHRGQRLPMGSAIRLAGDRLLTAALDVTNGVPRWRIRLGLLTE